MDLVTLKSRFISQLKARYSNDIMFKTYPQWKQGNIDGGRCGATAQDKTDMDTFLNGKWVDITTIEAEINALTVTDVLDNLALSGDDETRFAYMASYLPSCNTDERKLMALLALQDIKLIG